MVDVRWLLTLDDLYLVVVVKGPFGSELQNSNILDGWMIVSYAYVSKSWTCRTGVDL